jgi:hypothetical protein
MHGPDAKADSSAAAFLLADIARFSALTEA